MNRKIQKEQQQCNENWKANWKYIQVNQIGLKLTIEQFVSWFALLYWEWTLGYSIVFIYFECNIKIDFHAAIITNWMQYSWSNQILDSRLDIVTVNAYIQSHWILLG